MATEQDIKKFSATKKLPLEPVLFSYLEHYGSRKVQRTTEDKRQPREYLSELRKRTFDLRFQSSGMLLEPSSCSYLEWHARSVNGLRILEVGTFTGVTALALAFVALENAKKHNIDVVDWEYPLTAEATNVDIVNALVKQHGDDLSNKDKKPLVITLDVDTATVNEVSRPVWTAADVQSKPLVFIPGSGVDTLKAMLENECFLNSFDMVFVDADKDNYINYYELVLPLVKQGGLLCFDNVLWKGSVTKHLNAEELNGEEPIPVPHMRMDNSSFLHAFNKHVHADTERTDSIVLPIGDGLTVARKL